MTPRPLLVAFALGAGACTALKPATDHADALSDGDATGRPDAPVDDLADDALPDVPGTDVPVLDVPATDVPLDVPADTGPTTTDPSQIPPPRPIAPLSGSVVGASMPTVRFVMPGGFTTGVRVEVCADRACAFPDHTYTPTVVATSGTVASASVALPSMARKLFWRVRGVSGSGSGATPGAATSAAWLLQVDAPATERTLVQPSLADVNRDGYADLYVGVPREVTWSSNEGRARLFLGQSASPGIARTDSMAYAYPSGTLRQNPDAGTGTGAAIVGDMDGDGFADTATGGPCLGGSAGTCGPGAVIVGFGGAAGATPAPLLNGLGGSTERFGANVAGLSDFNGDGFADLAIGVPTAGGAQGALVLARTIPSGTTRRTLTSFRLVPTGDAHLTGLGNAVASAGDVDGDGLTDVIVGAPNTFGYIGAAYLVFGTASWTDSMLSPSPAYLEITSPFTGSSRFGQSVGGAGDIDGDGYADVVVGSPTHGNGSVMIYYGGHDAPSSVPSRTLQLDAPSGVTYFGQAVAGVGDLNADGYGDIAVGSLDPNAMYGDGQVRVYLGGPAGLRGSSPTVPAATLSPVRVGADGGTPVDSTTGHFGQVVAAAGDLDGDGYGDLAVSAPIAPTFHDDASGTMVTFGGHVLVYFGTATGVNTTPVVIPGMSVEPGNQFGTAISLVESVSRAGGRG